MSSEFELGDDGELIIHKHADSERIIRAMKLAIRKNSDEGGNPAAFRPAAAERRARLRRELAEADQDDEEEAERVRAARRRRQRLIETARESARLASTTRKAALTIDDLTDAVLSISKRVDPVTLNKLAAYEIAQGSSRFSNFERASMIGAIAKAAGGAGSDDQRFARFLQAPENTQLRRWALLHPDKAELAKRATLLDDSVTKVSSPGAAPAIGGREALAVGRGSQGSKPTEADKLREAAIEQQMRLGRWQTVEEAARYVDGLEAELQRMARGKQERARPGTLERA
jgi:hypothetical protein